MSLFGDFEHHLQIFAGYYIPNSRPDVQLGHLPSPDTPPIPNCFVVLSIGHFSKALFRGEVRWGGQQCLDGHEYDALSRVCTQRVPRESWEHHVDVGWCCWSWRETTRKDEPLTWQNHGIKVRIFVARVVPGKGNPGPPQRIPRTCFFFFTTLSDGSCFCFGCQPGASLVIFWCWHMPLPFH